MEVDFYLEWFPKDGDFIHGDALLPGVGWETVRQQFGLPEDSFFGPLDVTEKQKAWLLPFMPEDSERFEFFVSNYRKRDDK
jgi:hypothetical protein